MMYARVAFEPNLIKRRKWLISMSCKNNLKYHIARSNYVAYIFRHANQLVLDIEKAENHGWNEEGKVCWSDECYPEEVSDFLLEKEHGGVDSLSDNDDSESYFEDDIDDDVEDVADF